MLAAIPSCLKIPVQISSLNLVIQREAEIEEIPGDTWIEKLKYTFDQASARKDEAVTINEWMNSRINLLISDKVLNMHEMEESFNQIDANCDGLVQWAELIDFLICHKPQNDELGEKTLSFEYIAPDAVTLGKNQRASICKRCQYLQYLNQILTLSDNTLTFWNPYSCTQVRSFSDGAPFTDFCHLSNIHKLAITKQNRQIIFFDLRSFKKLDFYISAAVDSKTLPKMNLKESTKSLKSNAMQKLPLYYTPTAICTYPNSNLLFVGDDKGRLEIFDIFTSRNARYDWDYKRLKLMQMHNSTVTKIQLLSESDGFLSSSLDGTFVIWKYFPREKSVMKVYAYKERHNNAIRDFVYDSRTRDVVYMTTSHCFGVWRAFTRHSIIVDTNSSVLSTINIVSFSGDVSYVVAISTTNFISIYRLPNVILLSSTYMGTQHELCTPTGSLFLDNRLYLVGAFLSAWNSESVDCVNMQMHTSSIVGAFANDVFGRIITVAQNGELFDWELTNGKKDFVLNLTESEAVVNCFAFDRMKRRFGIGYSNGVVKIHTSNSGTVLGEIDRQYFKGGCTSILFSSIYQTNRIICSTGNKSVVLFEDLSGNRTRFVRNFVGHNENVVKTVVLKDSYLLSVGSEHELFLWRIQQQNPLHKFDLDIEPTTAADILTDMDLFIIGDAAGNVHIMSLELLAPVKTLIGFGMSVRSPITYITVGDDLPIIIAGNYHGYIKCWLITDTDFPELRRFRAHDSDIVSISLSEKHRVVITSGKDEQIRIWSIQPFNMVGQLGCNKKWDITNAKNFLNMEPLEDDPQHFVEKNQDENQLRNNDDDDSGDSDDGEGDSENEEEEEEKLFDIDEINQLLEKAPEQIKSGRKIVQRAKFRVDDLPRYERPKPPPRPDLSFSRLVHYPEFDYAKNYLSETSRNLESPIINPQDSFVCAMKEYLNARAAAGIT